MSLIAADSEVLTMHEELLRSSAPATVATLRGQIHFGFSPFLAATQAMNIRRTIVASITFALAFLPGYALSAPPFPRAMTVLHIEDGGVYSTDWTVYPLRVERTATSSEKPEEMILGVFQDGKEGGFEGVVQISCNQPIDSYVTTGRNGFDQFNDVSLKDMMKTEVFPRKLVANIFALFCKGSSLKAADLNMSRD